MSNRKKSSRTWIRIMMSLLFGVMLIACILRNGHWIEVLLLSIVLILSLIVTIVAYLLERKSVRSRSSENEEEILVSIITHRSCKFLMLAFIYTGLMLPVLFAFGIYDMGVAYVACLGFSCAGVIVVTIYILYMRKYHPDELDVPKSIRTNKKNTEPQQ